MKNLILTICGVSLFVLGNAYPTTNVYAATNAIIPTQIEILGGDLTIEITGTTTYENDILTMENIVNGIIPQIQLPYFKVFNHIFAWSTN